jgi:hypothetical protein
MCDWELRYDVGVLNVRFCFGKTDHDEGRPGGVIGQTEGDGEEEDGDKMMEHFVLMMISGRLVKDC